MSLILRFTTNNHSLISKGIRLFTWSPWSHVEYLIPGEGYLGSHVQGGVMMRSFDYDRHCQFCFATIDVKPTVEKAVLEFARSKIGCKYDLRAIIGIALHKDWQDANEYFCSAFVEASQIAGGFPLVRESEKLDRVTPGLLFDSALLQQVLQGCNCPMCGMFDLIDPTKSY